jgi:hypothetical protein
MMPHRVIAAVMMAAIVSSKCACGSDTAPAKSFSLLLPYHLSSAVDRPEINTIEKGKRRGIMSRKSKGAHDFSEPLLNNPLRKQD